MTTAAGKIRKLTYLVWLECNHSIPFVEPVPVKDDVIWCQKCRSEKLVMDAPADFRANCLNCSYCKPFGRAKLQTQIAAGNHRIANPKHVVQILDGHVEIDRFGKRDLNDTLPLPERDDGMPF